MTSHAQNDQIARRIKALRERGNVTQAVLAAQLGFKDRQTLAAIEAGERRVSPEELIRLARVFGVDVDTFLDPYRLIGEGAFSFRAKEVPSTTLADFEAEAGCWIATYRQLGIQAGKPPRRMGQKLELNRWSSFEDAEASAEMLWQEWRLGDVPAARLEKALDSELGVLVLYVDAPEGISGAASQLPGLQTILVNRRESAGRRSFDLAHELFHLLTWDAMPPRHVEPVEVKATKGNRVEQMAENFAAALLMPAPVVSARWVGRGEEDLSTWAGRIASELQVSVVALLWRLVNLGHVTRGEMDAALAAPRRGAPRVRDTMPLLFSRPFVERISAAVEDGNLSLRRAASLLGVTLAELAELCAAHGCPLPYDLPG